MEYTYKLNADDYMEYNQYLMTGASFKKKIQKQRVVSAIAVLAVGGICALFFKDKLLETAAVSVAAALILFLTFPSIVKGGMKSALLNMIRSDGESMFRDQTFRISDEGLHTESEDQGELITKDAALDELAGVSKSGELFLIHFKNGNLLMLPGRIISSEEEKENLLAICGGLVD